MPDPISTSTTATPAVGDAQMLAYSKDGYFVVPQLFAEDEIEILRSAAEHDMPNADVLTKQDQDGNKVSLKMWGHAGEDVYGLFSRNERIVRIAEQLIGQEAVYLYSAKMILKNARDGGAWEWHQDYGYWYTNGCLAPKMTSCLVAVDANSLDNGCLQALSGSHRLNRIDHVRRGEQFIADPERVEVALRHFERVHITLLPGDALFFHCNLLHRSDANKSDKRRWNFICSYNAATNRPYKQVRDYGHDVELQSVPANAIREHVNKKTAGP